MSKLQISENILSLGQFKAHASELLDSMNESNRSIVITQKGKPAAVLLSTSELDRLNTQTKFISAVQQGLNDEQAGRIIDDDELDAILERKLSAV